MNEERAHPYSHDDNFMVMLEHHCQNYHIITSTDGLTYRVEVYEKGDLEDAIEISCEELKNYLDSDVLFQTRYTQAHKKFVDKFCNQALVAPLEEKREEIKKNNVYCAGSSSVPAHTAKSRNILQNIKEYTHIRNPYRKKIFLLAGVFFLFIFLLLGRILLCNETLIHFFFNPKNYYEKTEFFCHKLEKKCIGLSKTNLDQNTELTPQECRNWCEKKIIDADNCALFLPYFPKEIQETGDTEYIETEPKNKDIPKTIEPANAYMFSPSGTLVLETHKDMKLHITNTDTKVFRIEVISLHLKENIYDEIVQFRSGVTTFSVEEGESKDFNIFLEPTYYEQFERGTYHGTILLKIIFDKNHSEEITKEFIFRVQ